MSVLILWSAAMKQSSLRHGHDMNAECMSDTNLSQVLTDHEVSQQGERVWSGPSERQDQSAVDLACFSICYHLVDLVKCVCLGLSVQDMARTNLGLDVDIILLDQLEHLATLFRGGQE